MSRKPKYMWTRWGSREGSIAAVPGGELRVFTGERSQVDEWEVIFHPDGYMSNERVAFGSARDINEARLAAEEAYERERAVRGIVH